MVVPVFHCRIRQDVEEEYAQWMADGERVAIVELESEAAQRLWARDTQHVEAKRKGRSDFYSEYRVQVCQLQYERKFSANQRPAVEVDAEAPSD